MQTQGIIHRIQIASTVVHTASLNVHSAFATQMAALGVAQGIFNRCREGVFSEDGTGLTVQTVSSQKNVSFS